MDMTTVVALLLWGTIVGLDLASLGQVMVARPLVAGTAAGWIIGDIQTGVVVGAVLELFALEVLPFGAARYPDYGVGAVTAVAVAGGAPGVLGIGIGIAVGLVIAYVGEASIQLVRQLAALDMQRRRDALDAGDVRVIYRLHRRGVLRDAARAVLLTALGLGLAAAVHSVTVVTVRGAVLLGVVATGIGLGTTFVSGLRVAHDARRGTAWLLAGIVAGTAWVLVT